MSNKPQASEDKKSNQPTTNWPRCGVFVALAALVVALLGFIFGPGILTRLINNLSTFSYIVRVVSKDTDKPLVNIKVELELNGRPPFQRVTDSSGIVTFELRQSVDGQTAQIVINADGYHTYSQNVIVSKDSQTNTIQLEPESNSTTPPQPPVTTTEQSVLPPSPTQTPENTATHTPQPTYTWTPTNTPTPTFTPSPTPAITLPFSDSFETPLSDAWTTPIPGGTWFTAGGKLTLSREAITSRPESYIFVGDPNWRNYTVKVDYWKNMYTVGVGVIIRSSVPKEMGIRFFVTGRDCSWQIWQDGEWVTVTSEKRPDFSVTGSIYVEANGNEFFGSVDQLTQLPFSYPDIPETGFVGLTSDCNSASNCSEFDNFVIEEYNP